MGLTRPLRVMWEPGYDSMTAYRNDTIWVIGEPGGTIEDTDEWDDDILLHEFGHYLMKGYAQVPPSATGEHTWWRAYPDRPGIGYSEGWAHFFSARARAGSGTDTLIVDTNRGIGAGSVYLWCNIENPWLGSYFTPPEFEGGPWCEGAVAGVLWDIYDSKDEIPYPSYPWPGFPDTALADTLTKGFAPIWHVFDHYNPPGEPTNCWTIFHFRSGWNSYNYGHPVALNQILLHHRIRDSIPARPTGLSCTQVGNAVRLYWRKNTESDLKGYRLYRRSKQEFTIPPQPWSNWVFLAEKDSPNDTTHLDQTVQSGWRYRYRITAYDTLGNESGYSDSVEILVQFEINPPNIKRLSFDLPSVIPLKGGIKICFNASDFNQRIRVRLYDVSGRLVQKESFVPKGIGNNRFTFMFKGLSSGVYFVQVESEEYNKIKKIIIVR